MSPLVNLRENWRGVCQSAETGRGDARITYVVDHVLQSQDFLCARRGPPTQQDGKVEEGSGENVPVLIVLEVGRVVTFAQLLPVLIDEQAEMGELRRFPVECLVQLDMFWRGKKPLL
jgi:hypothetical protein